MHREELQLVTINKYNLAATFCRITYAKGGICMYVHKGLEIISTDIENYCKEKDFEACAIKPNLNSTYICIITIYRAPSGNFNLFINKLDTILRELYNPALDFIICGDINIDYLKNTEQKNQLENLLLTHSCRSEYYYSTASHASSPAGVLLLRHFQKLVKKKYWSYWLQVCTIRLPHVCSFSACVQLPSSLVGA